MVESSEKLVKLECFHVQKLRYVGNKTQHIDKRSEHNDT